MKVLTKRLIEEALENSDLTPLLAIGTIVAKEAMANNSCLVGFNLLDELQIEKSNHALTIPIDYKSMSPTSLAKVLLDKGASEETILKILEIVCND
jgi:hypothetical protein